MESFAAFPDGEWDSFNRFLSIEELDFTHQLHFFSFPLEHGKGLSCINPSTLSSAVVNEGLLYSNHEHEAYYLTGPNHIAATNEMTMSLDISMDNNGGTSDKITDSFPPAFPNITMEGLSTDHCLGKLDASHPAAANVVVGNELLLKKKFNVLELHAEGDQIGNISSDNTKKRTRVSKDAAKVYKNVQYSKKNRKINLNGNEGDGNIGSDCSTTCSSEDDNVSQDTNNGVAASDSKGCRALNLNGTTRASRGSATDPQSLYARKRRERINERLRILQNLIPNGTKVDISTMLEEAVHYVKFLQLQIKLLSSADLWMYAPIAYNGIDIGLNKKISKLLHMNPGKEATS